MKKWLGIVLLSLVALVAAEAALAQTASSKATAAVNTAVGCTVSNITNIGTAPLTCHDIFSGAAVPVAADNFVTVMKSTVKVSNSQSLFVSSSMVTGLYTSTTTKTKTGSTSTVTAMGGVYERAVLLDASGNVVVAFPVAECAPGILGCQSNGTDYGVTIDSRVQTLTQSLSDCVVNVGILTGTCTFDSTIGLVLQTTSAHTFNFIFPNVGVGTYTVEIQMAVNSGAQIVTGSGSAVGAAAFGLGSVTIESVRMVHDFSF